MMKRLIYIVYSVCCAYMCAPGSLIAQTVSMEGPSTPASPLVKIITLRQAQKAAAETNMDFKNIRETVYQAQMSVYQAWSMLLPNLSAEASITRNQREISISLPISDDEQLAFTIQDLWAKTAGFGANLTLFNPQSIPLIKLAYNELEREKLQAQISRNELLFAVTSAYYQAYSLKETIRTAEENLAMAREFLRHAEALHKAGQGTKIDVNRGEMQVLNAQANLDDAIDAKKQAMTVLKYLIHEEDEFDIAGPEAVAPGGDTLDSLQQKALSNRLELKAAGLQKKTTDLSRKETVTKFLPKLDITYSWSWSSAEGFTGSSINWMLIFGAKWQLFQGGYRIAEYKSGKSQTRIANNEIEKLVRDLKQDVETKYLDVEQKRRSVETADKQAALAEDNRLRINKQFEAGIISSLDVADATAELASSRLMQVYKRLLFDLSVLTLKKAAGEYNSLAFADTSR